jgi:uncharacterized membrane protein YccC
LAAKELAAKSVSTVYKCGMDSSASPASSPTIFQLIGRQLAVLARFEFLSDDFRPRLSFAIRTWLASMLALWLAFFLQLDEPYWAGLTVWILAQPTPGATISRSIYRIAGTIVGAIMGVVLIAFFSQTPELFILALALWMATCTVISNLLRNFTAYAAVLAGYTAAIISLAAYQTPNQVFDIAMARAAANLLGIACVALSASLFAPHNARRLVITQMGAAIRAFAKRGAYPVSGTFQDRLALGRPLVNNLITIEGIIDSAAAESPEFRIHADLARALLVRLFGAISAKRALDAHLIRHGMIQDAETLTRYNETMALLDDTPRRMDLDQWREIEADAEAIRFRLRGHVPEELGHDLPQIISSRLIVDRLDDLLRHFGRALHDWRGIQLGYRLETRVWLDFHRDQRSAWINGARAFLAVIVAGAFWIASAWPSGSAMLIMVAVACSLFSALPRPDAAGFTFLKGSIYATIFGFICNFYLLQSISEFPLFMLCYGICLVPGALGMLKAETALIGLAYTVNFMSISRPLNPMNYDVVSFMNNAMATLVGVWCGSLAYVLFMPPNPPAARRYVVRRIRHGLRVISTCEPMPPPTQWQTRMYDRVNRLYQPANPSATTTDEWYEGGLGALNLGNEVLRLRKLLKRGKLGNEVSNLLRSVLSSFEQILTQPHSTHVTIQAVNAALQHTQPPVETGARRSWYRAVGIIGEMEAFFIEHPRFLSPG